MSNSEKKIFGVSFGGFILWQCYLAFFGVRQIEQMEALYVNFGSVLPDVTEIWLATGSWFYAVPVISAIISFVCLTKNDVCFKFCLLALIGIVLVTFLLQAFMFEAIFAPINKMASPI
jgi:hypothetical protein